MELATPLVTIDYHPEVSHEYPSDSALFGPSLSSVFHVDRRLVSLRFLADCGETEAHACDYRANVSPPDA